MALRIWLHEGHDGEPGLVALGLEQLGFATWAETADELLARIPDRFEEYAAWRARHGRPVAGAGRGVEIAGRLAGNEILFPPDREPATHDEIDLAIALLAASRADLVAELEAAPEAALDWDPPYRRFAPWADWRTIRAILAHVANGETHYYTRSIGHGFGEEWWSVRKALRRLVSHERAHAKSVRRILRAYAAEPMQ